MSVALSTYAIGYLLALTQGSWPIGIPCNPPYCARQFKNFKDPGLGIVPMRLACPAGLLAQPCGHAWIPQVDSIEHGTSKDTSRATGGSGILKKTLARAWEQNHRDPPKDRCVMDVDPGSTALILLPALFYEDRAGAFCLYYITETYISK